MSYLYETGSRYKNYRFSPKGKHLWEQIRRLNGFAKNLCSAYDESYCFNESLCYRRHKHLPFQCEYTDNETLAAYAKGNYDFGNLEQIEEFFLFLRVPLKLVLFLSIKLMPLINLNVLPIRLTKLFAKYMS